MRLAVAKACRGTTVRAAKAYRGCSLQDMVFVFVILIFSNKNKKGDFMKYLKRRIAVFLCMVLVFCTAFVAVPTEKAQAGDGSIEWIYKDEFDSFHGYGWYSSDGYHQYIYEVELGEKNFYVGDYIAERKNSYHNNSDRLIYHSGVVYRSDNSSVAAVNASTGEVTAKKVGSAGISVTYRGKTATCTIKVVPAASLASYRPASEYEYMQLQTGAKNMIKLFGGGKITAKNRYAILKEINRYMPSWSLSGMKWEEYYNASGKFFTLHVYSPSAVHAFLLYENACQYAKQRNPFSTESSKTFKVKEISGKDRDVTVTLTKPVDADQMFGMQYALSIKEPFDRKSLKFPVYLLDLESGKSQSASAVVQKGSKTMAITLRSGKLKKGKTYLLVFYKENLKSYDFLKAPYTLKKCQFLYTMYGNINNAWLSICKHSFRAK